jgi:hypothetical protein
MNALKPVRNPSLAWRTIEGEVVVISPEDSLVHELNETASFIWNVTNGERTSTEIAELLAQEFEVSPEVARVDAEELIAALQEKKLLLISPETEGGHHA